MRTARARRLRLGPVAASGPAGIPARRVVAWGLAAMCRNRRRGIVGYTTESSASPRRRGPGGHGKGESNDQVTRPAESTETSPADAGGAGRRRSRGGTGGVRLVRRFLGQRQLVRRYQRPYGGGRGQPKPAKIGGAKVLTSGKGFTLYSFAPDTSAKSNCNGRARRTGRRSRRGDRIRGQGHVRHDQALRRLNAGHLRRASAVHLRRRHRPRAGQGQRPERGRRAVARSHHLRQRPGRHSASGSGGGGTGTAETAAQATRRTDR